MASIHAQRRAEEQQKRVADNVAIKTAEEERKKQLANDQKAAGKELKEKNRKARETIEAQNTAIASAMGKPMTMDELRKRNEEINKKLGIRR